MYTAFWFGTFFAMLKVSDNPVLLSDPVGISKIALGYGGAFGVLSAVLRKTSTSKFDALYMPGTAFDQGGLSALLTGGWPIIGVVGGLGLLLLGPKPIWAALFVALMLCLGPAYRKPYPNRDIPEWARLSVLVRAIVILAFSLGIVWIEVG